MKGNFTKKTKRKHEMKNVQAMIAQEKQENPEAPLGLPVVEINRLEQFLVEFLNNGGNATQAAMKIGNYKRNVVARNVGSRYLKQVRHIAALYMEKHGYGYGKMLDVAARKMEQSRTPEWWDRLMKLSGYADFITKQAEPAVSVNVFQAHKDLAAEYIDGEIDDVTTIESDDEKE